VPDAAADKSDSAACTFRTRRRERWHRRAGAKFRHSLRWRLVAMFLVLALAMTGTFLFGMQKAMTLGWRAAARPLVADYVDRVVADLGTPPSVEKAQELVARLPLSLHIEGPVVHWDSHPDRPSAAWRRRMGEDGEPTLLVRQTADGHRIVLGLGGVAWERQPRRIGWITLAVLLVLTAVAYAYVRRLLRPLQDIGDGAARFGSGAFAEPIPVRKRDELGDLAGRINTMAHDLHQMLEAKRALLLAISHELRSPLTRARLNAELLPESEDLKGVREPLMRDLKLMRDLISDLLESERLASPHAALNLEPVDLAALAREVAGAATGDALDARAVTLELERGPALMLDQVRIRLLLRNLLDNALRHGGEGQGGAVLRVFHDGDAMLIQVRDHGPGVDPAVLSQLAEPFYRVDDARQRSTGGVGLGLYLCRLVAQAHGGTLEFRNAEPGLEITARLPMVLPAKSPATLAGAAASGAAL
jgi:signal transduction histidine kinase